MKCNHPPSPRRAGEDGLLLYAVNIRSAESCHETCQAARLFLENKPGTLRITPEKKLRKMDNDVENPWQTCHIVTLQGEFENACNE